MKLYKFQQTKDLEAVCELISMEERFEQKYSIEANYSVSFNEKQTQKQQNKLSRSIFNQNDILSNLQDYSIRRSVISVKSDISLEDNDYHHRTSQKRLISLPIPVKNLRQLKTISANSRLVNLNEKIDKMTAFVEHILYRISQIGDNLVILKKSKMNIRICKSDDEGETDNGFTRNIFSSKRKIKNKKRGSLFENFDWENDWVEKDNKSQLLQLQSEHQLLQENLNYFLKQRGVE